MPSDLNQWLFDDDEAFESDPNERRERRALGVPKEDQPRMARKAAAGPSLKARAIDFLSRREHSRTELARKLLRHSDENDDVEAVLDELEAQNWLSDQRYAQSLINRRAHKHGMRRIVQELKINGVDAAHISAVTEQLEETEYERAFEVWERKFGRLPDDQKSYARQFRFIASRGFGSDIFRKILDKVKQQGDDY